MKKKVVIVCDICVFFVRLGNLGLGVNCILGSDIFWEVMYIFLSY